MRRSASDDNAVGARRLATVSAAAMVAGLVSIVPAQAAVPPQGCVLAVPGSSCAFVATQVASVVGRGPFHITVSDQTGHVRYDTEEPAGAIVQPLTSLGDPNQIGIGDRVRAEVTGPGGVVAIGNPGAVPSSGPHTPPPAPALEGDVSPVHDPAMAFAGGWYYLFSTGAGIPVRRSTDLLHWESAGTVFSTDLPSWAAAAVPGTQIPWAPDVSYFHGAWHLYYAISTFGGKRSAIGLATSTTLDGRNGWHDTGPVLTSSELSSYNAIDPNVVIDAGGAPHLVFGSFTGGIQVVDLDPATGHPTTVPLPLATNVQEYTAVEGAFMIARDGWYYLFASYDYCCRGTDSTYNVRVGRARSVDGPFLDDLGIPMLLGGGRSVLTSNGAMRGPGGEGLIGNDIFFHWYDAAHGGAPTLGIEALGWTADGWPVATIRRTA